MYPYTPASPYHCYHSYNPRWAIRMEHTSLPVQPMNHCMATHKHQHMGTACATSGTLPPLVGALGPKNEIIFQSSTWFVHRGIEQKIT